MKKILALLLAALLALGATACGGGGFCAACFDGNYPDSVTDDETGKFIFE